MKDKKIILELSPEEVKLLAYGAMPPGLKERLLEIAYYLDDGEWTKKKSHREELNMK